MSDRSINKPPASAYRQRAGFTLLELLVSLGVGGIAITSIYAVGASATRQFQQQEHVASTQSALRIAMRQLKRDFARAGFLATPNVYPATGSAQLCGNVAAELDDTLDVSLSAFSNFRDNVDVTDTAVDPEGTDNDPADFSADQIVLLGNYETSSEYAGVRKKDSTHIFLNQNWQAFQRDFTNWYEADPPQFQAQAFNEVFKVGRLIRIQTTHKLRHFAIIRDVSSPVGGEDVEIEFEPEIPAPCLDLIDNGWVAPLSTIQFFVRETQGVRMTQNGRIGQLVRREVKPDEKDVFLPMDGDPDGVEEDNANTRSILDYVVSFNLSFKVTAATAPGLPDAYKAEDMPITTETDINNFPERIRSVQVDLAARTPLQDPSLVWSRTNCSQLRCFQVLPSTGGTGTQGAARVRRMRAEVFVPNVAFEGY